MSIQSDAAKAHIEKLMREQYPDKYEEGYFGVIPKPEWSPEYRFVEPCDIAHRFHHKTACRECIRDGYCTVHAWRFDYAVPSILCANLRASYIHFLSLPRSQGEIELDGGTFMGARTGHSTGVALRNWREKNNTAMKLGWRVWHYAPEEVIKAGRKTLPDEPILKRLPWL